VRAHLPSPLVGEDRLGRRPSAEGGRRAWSALSTKPSAVSAARGRGLTDRLPLAPAADVAAASFDQEAYARRPPSRSAFGRVGPPHKGEEGRLGQQMRESLPAEEGGLGHRPSRLGNGAGGPRRPRPSRGLRTSNVGGAHFPPPAREASGGEGRLGRSPSGVGGASPRRFVDVRRGCRWQPWPNHRVILVALAPRPAIPHPYPSPPLGFAARGEGGARSRHG